MEDTAIVFTFTNVLTGWRVDVLDHGQEFTVEQYDVDGAYMGHTTFTSDTKAIAHAILIS